MLRLRFILTNLFVFLIKLKLRVNRSGLVIYGIKSLKLSI